MGLNLRHHIVSAYDRELTKLRGLVLDMGERVIDQTQTAVSALLNGNLNTARTVLEREPRIDDLNIEADEEIFSLIVRRQPTAIDLRLVLALSKIVNELERGGDKAERIARAVISLLDSGGLPIVTPILDNLRQLDSIACCMLERSLDATAAADIDRAVTIFESETQLYQVTAALRTRLLAPDTGLTSTQFAELISISFGLERIGNHGANIAEQVIYIVRGDDIRYRNRELLIDALRHTNGSRADDTQPLSPC